MRIWVYSGRPSEGAAFLAAEDGFRRSKTGNFVKAGDVIVNWGNVGKIPGAHNGPNIRILNKQDAVELGRNKLKTFKVMKEYNIPCLPWTTFQHEAADWVAQGHTVVARKTLTGCEGAGIVIVEPGNELIQAPLYTRYINKVREFRVHATPYGVIDTQWKVHDPKLGPPKSWKVRSYANGFIFQRKGVIPSAQRDALAIQAVKALGLDFGGLDIIEDKNGNFYVVEVNTAPGIERTTVTKYGEALRALAQGIHPAAGLGQAGFGGPKPSAVAVQPAPKPLYPDDIHPLWKPGGYLNVRRNLNAPGPAGPGLRSNRNLNQLWSH